MVEKDLNSLNRGRAPKKLGTATLDGTISVKQIGKEKVIFVGNSSLVFTFTDIGSDIQVSGDFSLGEKSTPIYLPPLMGLKMFCYGMVHLRNFLLTNNEIDISRLRPLEQSSNDSFLDFMWGLFSAGGHPELATGSKETSKLIFDLKGFLELPEEDPLIQSMLLFSRRAEGMEVKTLIPINPT